MADINIDAFVGMNNLKDGERFYAKKNVAEPRIILNADVDNAGRLVKRSGPSLHIELEGAHSLSAGVSSCMLCAAKNKLYRLRQGQAEEITDISGPDAPLVYEEAAGKVYISNLYWRGVFTPSENSVANWGVGPPPGPMLIEGSGNLPAGTYYVCMTNVSNGEMSGSGPIAEIELSDEGGIQVLNRPDDAIVWATDANEGVFQKVGATDTIVDIPTVEPLPSLFCSPPPYLDVLCHAFGRMWGASGNVLYYSEPYQLGWWKHNAGRMQFDFTINMIARVPTGLFVGGNDRTVFLAGDSPEKMAELYAGAGAIRGSLVYCNNVPELGDVLGTPEKVHVDVPIWRTTEGVVIGNASGRLFNLTKDKLTMGVPDRAASLYRIQNGVFQFLSSAKIGLSASGRGNIDPAVKALLESGQINLSSITNSTPDSMVGFSDSVEVEHRRGGEVI